MLSASSTTLFANTFNPRVTIRPATLNDIDALSWLAIEAYKQTYRLLEYLATNKLDEWFGCDFREKTLPAELKSDKYQYLVCEDNEGRVVGFSKVKFKDQYAYLDKLYLLRDYQGAGNGHRLLLECFKLAAERGLYSMELIVWDRNAKAQEFYKKHGFVIRGERVPFSPSGIATGLYNYVMVCPDVRPYCGFRATDLPKPNS